MRKKTTKRRGRERGEKTDDDCPTIASSLSQTEANREREKKKEEWKEKRKKRGRMGRFFTPLPPRSGARRSLKRKENWGEKKGGRRDAEPGILSKQFLLRKKGGKNWGRGMCGRRKGKKRNSQIALTSF